MIPIIILNKTCITSLPNILILIKLLKQTCVAIFLYLDDKVKKITLLIVRQI